MSGNTTGGGRGGGGGGVGGFGLLVGPWVFLFHHIANICND
jgi:hypothetical protein